MRTFLRLIRMVRFEGEPWKSTWVFLGKFQARFAIGDAVTWTEKRPDGSRVSRVGLVAEVIPPGEEPTKPVSLAFARDHYSYVVFTGQKFRWPSAYKLEPATPEATPEEKK